MEDEDFEKLNTYINEINKEIKIKARFKIISNLTTSKDESKKLGTYGFIQQPWRIIKDKNIFHFYICRTIGYGLMGYDLQKMIGKMYVRGWKIKLNRRN